MSVVPSARKTAVGQIVAGRYELASVLGEGGFGVVYRARDRATGELVALKMMTKAGARHASSVARFEREAELARKLTHPNTVRILDFGTNDGVPFIAWELLSGRTLEAAIEASPLSVEQVARIAVEMLGSLAEAHALGVVHRDVKPANVFLVDGTPRTPTCAKMLDFGVAKLLDNEGDPNPLTRNGEVPGTPSYMAPEQLSRGTITPAIDLYAVGLVMSEALTGRRVYDGDTALDVLRHLIADGPTPIPAAVLASPLGPVIERATRKAAEERFASASEMIALLDGIPAASSSLGALDTMAAGASSHVVIGRPTNPGATPDTMTPDAAMRDTELPPSDGPSRPAPSADEVVARARAALEQDVTVRGVTAAEWSDPTPKSAPGPTLASPSSTRAETTRVQVPVTPPAARWVKALIVVLSITTVAAVATSIVAVRSARSAQRPGSGSAVDVPPHPHSPVTLKELENEATMIAKLKSEGWTVIKTAPSLAILKASSYAITRGPMLAGSVSLYRVPDATQLSMMEASMRLAPGTAVKSSGNLLLSIICGDNGPAARDLLAAIAK